MALQEEFESQGNFLFKHRSYLPLTIVVVALVVFVDNKVSGNFVQDSTYKLVEYLSLIVSLFGLGIRVYSVGHTPANTSGRNTKEGQLADELNISGIYSTVRHPLYLGNFFMWLGAAILTVNVWFVVAFALLYWVYYERIMYAEEQFLRRKFGKSYTDWADSTPAFIPSGKNITPSIYPFSIRKVLKKEKNGLLAIFVLLFLFHNIGESIENMSFTVDFGWISYGLLATGVLYLLLKVQKRSKWLNEAGR